MKKPLLFFSVIISLLICKNASAQAWLKNIPTEKTANFYDIQKAFNAYWKDKKPSNQEEENEADGGYQQFKRWEHFMEPRVYPSGNFDPNVLWSEYAKYNSKRAPQSINATANWSVIGPVNVPLNGGGAGRINVLQFDPQNSSIMWVGAPNGGLWKSTNGGTSWTSNTDLLPNISIADIAIDPINTNNMYLATGDGYGYEAGGPFWGGTYSAGVLKSTDGGATWNTTGLTYVQTQNNIIQRLLIDPVDPQILIAAARDGIWRTTNGGTTWNNVKTGHFYDMEFNTANPAIAYAVTADVVFRSLDTGATWNTVAAGLPFGNDRISMAVTPADSSIIYLLVSEAGGTGGVYKSTDAGTSFSYVGVGDVGYGYYNTVISVSPVDPNICYTSGLDVSKSTDGGLSWSAVSNWYGWPASNYVHADGHDIKFLPGSGTTVFAMNDGGIFKTDDDAGTWTNLSSGISIAQFYRLSCSATNPNYVFCGQQDNGCVRYNGVNWQMMMLADGMEQLVDYTDPDIVYSSIQNGAISKSTNGGNTYYDISPDPNGSWITPYVMDPNNNQILYAAYADVYQTWDGGGGWALISSNLTGSTTDLLTTLVVAPSNSLTIYTSTTNAIFRTTDGGGTWTTITAGLPVSSSVITYTAVSSIDPKKIWVTLSGYSSGNKVFMSTNGGNTWVNVSGTLPNIPVNCVVYQKNSPDVVYIGTDFGVFMRDSIMSDWVPFNNGLPNVIIDELEIQYSSGKLRAATYGRGLWQTPIYNPAGVNENETEKNTFLYPNPNSGNFTVRSNAISRIEVFNTIGEKIREIKTNGMESTVDINVSGNAPGVYLVKIETKKGIMNRKITVTN